MIGVIQSLLIAIVASWLTAQFSLRRFYRERWWDKKYEAYASLLNTLHTIRRGFAQDQAILVMDDGIADRKRAEKAVRDYQNARAELHRVVDLGEFIVSAATLAELKKLQSKFSEEPGKNYLAHFVHLSAAIDGCLTRVRELAREDLNPAFLGELRRFWADTVKVLRSPKPD